MSLKSFLKSIFPVVAFFSEFHFPKAPRKIINLLFIVLFISTVTVYNLIFKDLPSPTSLSSTPPPLTTHIRDRNGTELYKIYLSQNRTLIKLTDLPTYVKEALISIEDKDFYKHHGFSVKALLRALTSNLNCQLLNVKCQISIQGGSTITQQLVKTALLSPERTIKRKLRELALSLLVEHLYTKDQILEMYLNRVSFGGSAYGIEEASQTYFGVSAKNLSLAQATLLVGLPASPTTYSPFGNYPQLAKARQKEVLRRMVANNFISWEQAEDTSNSELKFRPPTTNIQAPHFVMYVKDLLAEKYGTAVVEQGGLDVITSLDLSTQQSAEQVLEEELNKISYLKVNNGAVLVTSPQTGEILAMVGSKNYFDLENDGNVNVTNSPRQPGSSIKPINYALAFSKGFSPSSLIDDSPITYFTAGQPPYTPLNYDGRFHGRVSLRTALASSYNIPAVKLQSAIGTTNLIDLGQKMGISTWTDPSRFGLSLTLGSGEVTMLDMATVYGVFANLGNKVALHPILSVKDSKGTILEKLDTGLIHPERILDPKIAFLVTDILSDNQARSPTFGLYSDLFIPNRPVAVKTGTTNNLRDNWTIGYTPSRLVAVWVGNNDNTPMSYIASGVTGASPIWKKIITSITNNAPIEAFTVPPGLKRLAICPTTNQLACSACLGKTDYFIPGSEPKSACNNDVIQKLVEANRAKLTP